MDALLKFVLGICLAVMGYWYHSAHGSSTSHPNAPEEAIEYFESSEGYLYLTLFEDELIWGDDRPGGSGEVIFPLSEITRVHKVGMNLKVHKSDGAMLELSMENPLVARRFKEKIEELQQAQ